MSDIPPVPGAQGVVPIVVTSVDVTGGTATVRVTDQNGTPITPNATLPIGIVTITAPPVAVGDVIQNLQSGVTAVVMWTDPGDARMWSPKSNGGNPQNSIGWKKIGTFIPS